MDEIGQDGVQLLSEVFKAPRGQDLRQLRVVEGLRRIWVQQFFWQEGRLCLRNKDDLPPAHLTLRSPYDHDAHYGHKRDMSWYGYKVHFTETCDEKLPHVITHVVTTDATKTDMEQTREIHEALVRRVGRRDDAIRAIGGELFVDVASEAISAQDVGDARPK